MQVHHADTCNISVETDLSSFSYQLVLVNENIESDRKPTAQL